MTSLISRSTAGSRRTAVLTGASAGLGRALAHRLAAGDWRLVVDARHPAGLDALRCELIDQVGPSVELVTVPGDVADPHHRSQLIDAAGERIDALINNASDLGAPLSTLRTISEETVERLWAVNVAAPLALIRLAVPRMVTGGTVINISSDAAIEHYPTWGGYGATKAALDHLTLTLATEEGRLRFVAVDPGDMRTAMHQAAFPGEDISDRPEPDVSAGRLVALLDSSLASGRYRAAELPDPAGHPQGARR
ncbi:MAG TPA: SDR family oxidoreductase [Microlunatus sp.]|nr:SDR family oxidoreductase [Microlunatus sp.]